MKVFLINPPSLDKVKVVREGRCMQRKGAWTAVWSPLSLALCAAVLEQEGIEVSLLDYTVKEGTPEQLMAQISSIKPDLVVLNVTTPSIEDDLKIVTMTKQAYPETKTAIIGIHPTALPNECFNACKELDYIIRREPEFTLRELCRAIECSTDIPVCVPNGRVETRLEGDNPFCFREATSCHLSRIKIRMVANAAFKVYFSAITACFQNVLAKASISAATIAGKQTIIPLRLKGVILSTMK